MNKKILAMSISAVCTAAVTFIAGFAAGIKTESKRKLKVSGYMDIIYDNDDITNPIDSKLLVEDLNDLKQKYIVLEVKTKIVEVEKPPQKNDA